MGATANLPIRSIQVDRLHDAAANPWVISFRRALPVLPNTLFQMNAVLSSAPVNLGRLVSVLGEDPAMTANLLREARSIDREVECDQLLDAVITTGIRRLQSLVIRTPMMTGVELNASSYRGWRSHSALAAVIAEAIAGGCGTPVMSQARMAGLLHDLGKLPLLLRNHVTERVVEEDRCDSAASGDVLDHCAAGVELGTAWGFTSALCAVMRDHHAEKADGASMLTSVVMAADRICHRCGVSLDQEMARSYAKQSLVEILHNALYWASEGQCQAAAESVRNAYRKWKLLTPGATFIEL